MRLEVKMFQPDFIVLDVFGGEDVPGLGPTADSVQLQQQQEEVMLVDAPYTRVPQAASPPRSTIKSRRQECRVYSLPSQLRES